MQNGGGDCMLDMRVQFITCPVQRSSSSKSTFCKHNGSETTFFFSIQKIINYIMTRTKQIKKIKTCTNTNTQKGVTLQTYNELLSQGTGVILPCNQVY